jgi:hypothetical protein
MVFLDVGVANQAPIGAELRSVLIDAPTVERRHQRFTSGHCRVENGWALPPGHEARSTRGATWIAVTKIKLGASGQQTGSN